MIRVVVVISGCGYLDGAEIFETVFTLLELDRNNVETRIFALNQKQHYVINYLTKKEVVEERNVLVESALIARGAIQSLNELQVKDFDALILPGGFGAVTNLST
jgi:enhancing lycopene biosynthesis protein 2